MKFNYIDIEKWKRKQHYNYYLKNVPCTYSMTIKLDITNVIKSQKKLYPTLLYCISKTVNKYEEFRTILDNEGKVGYFDELYPCYTIFHKENETFSNIWTEYSEDYEVFCKNYKEDMEKYGKNLDIVAKPDIPINSFPISMLPWESFEGFNLNLQRGYEYLLPIFTLGKYYQEQDKVFIPLAIQVHHSVCDGFHLCRFIDSLRKALGE